MIYNIETLSQSELFRLLMDIHDHYKIDAIVAERIREELGKMELLERQKQIFKDITNSGFTSEELREALTQMTGSKDKVETKEPPDYMPSSVGQKKSSNNTSDNHLNIVGRIDLGSINQRMRPEKKRKNIRLKKVATELNVGIQTIVQFLSTKGHQIETNPNTRISMIEYDLLLTAFKRERIIKDNSDK